MQRSPSLLGYSKLVEYIKREQSEGRELTEAIDTAVKACIREGLIEDFLMKHSREVSGMLFREMTMEEFAEIRARESYGKGKAEGEQIGLERGKTEGAAQEKREIAKNMKSKQIDLKTIFELTGLPITEIEKL